MARNNSTRREFMGTVGLSAAGYTLLSNIASAQPKKRTEFAKGPSESPNDVQLAIKPVFSPIIHSDIWEGPCRPSTGRKKNQGNAETADNERSPFWSLAEGRTPEQEMADAQETMKVLPGLLNTIPNPEYKMLEPVMVKYSEDFRIRPEELAKLEPDMDKTDIFLVVGSNTYNNTATVIGETFKKPVVIMGPGTVNPDASAYLKARGLEGYSVFIDFQELNHLALLLKTRKVFQQTSILSVSNRDLPPVPIRSCIWDLDMLKDRFGIEVHFVSYPEFTNEMEKVINSKEWSGRAQERAEQLIQNAEETHIDKQHVKRSFEFYYAVKNLMQKYGCNAFTVECFDLCASRLAEKYQIAPCLVHTLLKDEGIASACEGDFNALLAMRLLMSVSKKSSFMGNPWASADMYNYMTVSKDRFVINHSVPGIKMAGYNKPDSPYHLRHFVESGWGTKAMVDFMQFEEKTVTLARINPLATKIYLAKGEVVDCTGFNTGNLIGCSLAVHIKVSDTRKTLHKLDEFGSHLSMVYGDYTREIRELADMMDMEVVYAT